MRFLTNLRAKLARFIAPKVQQVRNAYASSIFSRLTQDWIFAASKSADQELRYELRILRNRARELDRNSPFGARYSQLLAENVVGPGGFTLQPKNKLKDGTALHGGANQSIKDAWKDWSRPDNCDVTGKLSLTEQLALAVSGWGTDGELLVRMLRGPRFGPYGFQLQILDVDYLDETLNQQPLGENPLIRQGVEMDEYGKPVAYWLWTRHPQEPAVDRERIRVPASDVIHAFIPKRAGQSRGVPHAAAMMQTIKMLDGYIEAELVAARIASATMGAIEDITEDGSAPAINPTAGVDNSGPNGDYLGVRPGGSEIPAEAEPGAMLDLRGKGAKLSLWDPQHPTSAFPDFTRMMSHFIAIGFGISYGTLTGDLSQANYGSLRVGMLDERDHWERYQQFIITHVLDRIYREWLKMALLNGRISGLSDFDVNRWSTVHWQPRGFDWIDPVKDAEGDFLEVAAGTNSLTRVCAKRGRDLDEILQERADEIAKFKAAGVESLLPGAVAAKGDTTTENANAAQQSQKALETIMAPMLQVQGGMERVIEQQAKAITASASKPTPPAEVRIEPTNVTIGEGAIQVTVENKLPAQRKAKGFRRNNDGSVTIEYEEVG